MSQENVDLVYQAIDAFNRRDIDAFLALMDSDVEFTPYERAVEGLGPYHGHGGVRTWWDESFATLPDFSAELLEVRDLGAVTFAHGRLRGTGAGSGAAFERTLWMAVEWRDGKQLWWHAFESEAEALEAAQRRDSDGETA
ncbi:MAG: nuclear transport factor 2 family protein [Thermoleophilaceae bacterium]